MLSFEKRINKKSFSLKICAASVVSAALLASAGHAGAKDKSTNRRGPSVKELEAENARLRQQLAATQQERDRLQAALDKPAEQASKPTGNPFAMKDLAQGYASTAKAERKETREMACGAAMAKNPEMKCGAAMKKSPEMSCGANMAGMESGSLMQFNPALSGSDFYHVHPKGMWMFNTKFMHMDMRGLQDGAKTVRLNQLFPYNRDIPRNKPPYGYMMAPTYMTMDMFMLMGMVGITDRLTVMGMVNYQTMDMGMLMNMGPGSTTVGQAPMRTYGLADSEIDATYAISKSVFGTLGLGIPTGSTSEKIEMMGRTYRAPYDMQNGSGTLALKPALSFHDLTDDALWMWGGQASYTAQLGSIHGYRRGDNVKLTAFLQRAFGPAAGWLRLNFNHTDRIHGEDPQIAQINLPMDEGGASMPDANPRNYGGQRLDALIGFSYGKGPFSVGVEGGVPVYQYLNGLQLKTTWILNAGFQAMF